MRWALFRSQVYNQEIRRVLGGGVCPELAKAIGHGYASDGQM